MVQFVEKCLSKIPNVFKKDELAMTNVIEDDTKTPMTHLSLEAATFALTSHTSKLSEFNALSWKKLDKQCT